MRFSVLYDCTGTVFIALLSSKLYSLGVQHMNCGELHPVISGLTAVHPHRSESQDLLCSLTLPASEYRFHQSSRWPNTNSALVLPFHPHHLPTRPPRRVHDDKHVLEPGLLLIDNHQMRYTAVLHHKHWKLAYLQTTSSFLILFWLLLLFAFFRSENTHGGRHNKHTTKMALNAFRG